MQDNYQVPYSVVPESIQVAMHPLFREFKRRGVPFVYMDSRVESQLCQVGFRVDDTTRPVIAIILTLCLMKAMEVWEHEPRYGMVPVRIQMTRPMFSRNGQGRVLPESMLRRVMPDRIDTYLFKDTDGSDPEVLFVQRGKLSIIRLFPGGKGGQLLSHAILEKLGVNESDEIRVTFTPDKAGNFTIQVWGRIAPIDTDILGRIFSGYSKWKASKQEREFEKLVISWSKALYDLPDGSCHFGWRDPLTGKQYHMYHLVVPFNGGTLLFEGNHLDACLRGLKQEDPKKGWKGLVDGSIRKKSC